MTLTEKDIRDLYSIIGTLCDQIERLNDEVVKLKGNKRAKCMTIMLNPKKKTLNKLIE